MVLRAVALIVTKIDSGIFVSGGVNMIATAIGGGALFGDVDVGNGFVVDRTTVGVVHHPKADLEVFALVVFKSDWLVFVAVDNGGVSGTDFFEGDGKFSGRLGKLDVFSDFGTGAVAVTAIVAVNEVVFSTDAGKFLDGAGVFYDAIGVDVFVSIKIGARYGIIRIDGYFERTKFGDEVAARVGIKIGGGDGEFDGVILAGGEVNISAFVSFVDTIAVKYESFVVFAATIVGMDDVGFGVGLIWVVASVVVVFEPVGVEEVNANFGGREDDLIGIEETNGRFDGGGGV